MSSEEYSLEGLDAECVRDWIRSNVPNSGAPLSFEAVTGGRSNLTFRVDEGNQARWVLRRPPVGSTLESAHDMAREYRINKALVSTEVPVPTNPAMCRDENVTGAPFLIVDFVNGAVVRSSKDAATYSSLEREAIGHSLIDTLAQIHSIRPEAVGLGGLGRSECYVERQIRRWSRQWDQSKTREIPELVVVRNKLISGIPAQRECTIVHGDYRLDNVIIGRDFSVAAVLDWELCTLGDPLADVGMLVAYWGNRSRGVNPLVDSPTLARGFMKADLVANRYSATSGRDMSDINYFVALAYWKIAVILEGILARQAFGRNREVTSADVADSEMVPRLVAEAHSLL